jgi:hypothetical protein
MAQKTEPTFEELLEDTQALITMMRLNGKLSDDVLIQTYRHIPPALEISYLTKKTQDQDGNTDD